MVGKPTIFHALGEEAEQRQTLPETNTEHCVLHSPYFTSFVCAGGVVVQPKHILPSSVHNRSECATSQRLQPTEHTKTHAEIISSHI